MKRVILSGLFGMLFVAGIIAMWQPAAHAFGTQYFDDGGASCDMSDCAGAEVRLIAGESKYVHQTGSTFAAYFTSNSGQVTVKQAQFCPGASGTKDLIQSGDYYDSHPLANGTPVTRYIVNGIEKDGKKYSGNDARCDDPIVFDLTGIPADPDHPGYYRAVIQVISVDHNVPKYEGIQDFYFVEATSGDAVALAQMGGTDGHHVTLQEGKGPDHLNYYIHFGSDCTVGPGGKLERLYYYDMDNDGGSGAQLGGKVTMKLHDETDGTDYTWPVKTDNNATGSSPLIRFLPNHKYTWHIVNVYRNNTLQFSTPFDGIFYKLDCNKPGNPPPPPPTPPPSAPPTKPYFQVTGGDVAAGASFATGTGASVTVPCSAAPHVTTAGITSWNNESGTFAGAGSEYATYALGVIQDFATGQGTGQSGPGGPATGLTFSNVNTSGSVNPSAGRFGGLFGSAPCVDYWETKPSFSSLPNFSGGAVSGLNGVYKHTGNLTITGSTIPTGGHVTIYVDGDVSIKNGDIKFANATWTKQTQIPSFKLIVHGSIFIDKAVTQLDGVYVAVPDTDGWQTSNSYGSPKPGTISTCSSDFTSYNPSADGASQPINDYCGSPLTINGAVAAQQLWLLRANGSGQGLPASPAEVINYTPETWLSIDTTSGNGSKLYQSIIGLPPVL